MKPLPQKHDALAASLHDDALAAWAAARPNEALLLVRQAIALAPNVAAYHANLGVMLKHVAPAEERIACYLRAVELEPNNALYLTNFVAALNDARRYSEAEVIGRKSLALDSGRHDTWHNLAGALAGQQKWSESAQAYETALSVGGPSVRTLMAAANAHFKCGQFSQAINRFEQVLVISDLELTQRTTCLRGVADSHAALGQNLKASQYLRRALEITPNDMHLLIDLGNVAKRLLHFEDAKKCYTRVLELDSNCIEAVFNLGAVEQASGNHDAALRLYRSVILSATTQPTIWNNLASCMTYSMDVHPQAIRVELEGFDTQIARPLRRELNLNRSHDPDRKLKVGYISADFRAHPVGYLALPVIEGHRRDEVHVTCYFSHHHSDHWTAKFKQASDSWVDVAGMSDASLCDKILEDEIDILVDLAGHTEGNRLLTFARKPAPVQVTWMGYVTTTGMRAMDWRITHIDADPLGSEASYSEQLWRIPSSLWCFRPLPGMPEVSKLPMETRKHVTFGSFNRFSKNSREALAAWAEILKRVPGSQLLMCATPGELEGSLMAFFAGRGIARDRIRTFSNVNHEQFWALHSEVDIALDPFPFNGGMTSCETLWLGVPLITCTGKPEPDFDESFPMRFSSRMGYTFVKALGLPELAVSTIPEYIDLAVSLANAPKQLMTVRASLRSRMMMSPLMDEVRFVRDLESAYRAMWHNYLRTSC